MALGSPQWMYNSGEAYKLEQSLKFEDSRSPYLQRTFTTGNRQAMTLSFWFKRATLGTTQIIFCATIPSGGSNNDNNFFALRIESDDKLAVVGYDTAWLRTNQKFRDPSAWYHCLLEINSTSGSGYNRVKMAINGTYLPSGDITTSYPSENHNHSFNVSGNYCNISSRTGWLGDGYFDGYLAEMHYIDGSTAYDQSHFGETGDYGEWKPIEVKAITDYGTNGFYLPFKADYSVEGFSTVLYKGTGVNPTYIGGTGFRPDITWVKPRSIADNHVIYDSVRGYQHQLKTNELAAEDVNHRVESAPDGFNITTTDGGNNHASHTYVAWNWDMGANTPTGFGCVKWKGNATARSITGVGFSPDLIIERNRDDTTFNLVYDKIRGAGKALRTNSSNAESGYASDEITAFEPDGFRVSTGGDVNGNTQECIAWCWDMGGTTATNTSGSITSTVMANTTYGQSIVKYTSSAGSCTVGHGLSSAPELILYKTLTANDWVVYHSSIGNAKKLRLNTNDPEGTTADFNSTSPTSSVFTDNLTGGSTDMIAYAFHSVANYSKFGSYTGNGSTTGPSVNIGFRPAFLMIKVADRTDGGNGAWWVFDSTRSFGTAIADVFLWNTTGAELHNNSNLAIDFLDNGFQLKSSYDEINVNNGKYVYMAFAGGVDSVSDFNTTGTIESRVKANTTYGQSIVAYEATGSAGTVGHGLSSAPEMMIVKHRDQAGTSWMVYNHQMATSNSHHKYLRLNSDVAMIDASEPWNDTAPTSSVFSIGANGGDTNNSSGGSTIAYLWHSVTGYSKIGRYTGNGSSTGPTITTNFRPAWIMIKPSTVVDHWNIYDTTRDPVNPINHLLFPNRNNVEGTGQDIEISDTGFQIKTSNTGSNQNGEYYIYMAFADKREYAYWLDQSGKNNDFTSHHLTESDISVDNPSNNFATLNPLDTVGTLNLKEGNLHYQSTLGMVRGTMAGNANDKFYLEYYQESNITGSNPAMIGIGAIEDQPHHESNHKASVMCHLDGNSQKRVRIFLNNSQVQSTDFDGLVGYNVGDILQFAYDGTTGKVWVGRNGTWLQGDPATGTSPIYTFSDTSKPMTAYVDHAGVAHAGMVNFGQDSSFGGRKTAQGYTDDNGKSDFYYEPPSGFLALSSANLKDAGLKPSEHFDVVTYTGNGGSKTISGYNFQPDMVWGKARSHAYNGHIHDAVRGVEKRLAPPTADIEYSDGALKTFTSDGYTFDTAGAINVNGATYVNWAWKANGSGSTNTDGSITTTVSANVDAGFSIIKYTGTNSSTPTIGHGLSKAPEFWVTKPRTDVGDNQWFCCHKDFASDYYTDFNHWDNNSPKQDTVPRWGDTAPTSSVITIGSASTNNSGDYICYAWHSVDGYSKIGYWTGNINTNGSFVYTGFRPKLVICKDLNNSNGWQMFDSVRSPNNPMDERLLIDLNNAEQTNVTAYDFVANGFKLRTNDSSFNGDANVYIYMAWAEVPQKYSNAR